ncbi:MAG: hypothetical protein WCY11_07745 [Novosphingobium sp.]
MARKHETSSAQKRHGWGGRLTSTVAVGVALGAAVIAARRRHDRADANGSGKQLPAVGNAMLTAVPHPGSSLPGHVQAPVAHFV